MRAPKLEGKLSVPPPATKKPKNHRKRLRKVIQNASLLRSP